jgi:hypothetical protein
MDKVQKYNSFNTGEHVSHCVGSYANDLSELYHIQPREVKLMQTKLL